MNISFKRVVLLRYPNTSQRNKVKSLENHSYNGNGNYWTSVPINIDKTNSDLLLITGLDLECAIENKKDNQTVSQYIRKNLDKYIKIAEIHDFRRKEE